MVPSAVLQTPSGMMPRWRAQGEDEPPVTRMATRTSRLIAMSVIVVIAGFALIRPP